MNNAPESMKEARAADLGAARMRNLLDAIERRKAADEEISQLVDQLHYRHHLSWRQLGTPLGMTGQGVNKRYGRPKLTVDGRAL